MLNIEIVPTFGPQREKNGTIEYAGNSKGEVVVFEKFRMGPEQQYSRNRVQENANGNGRVI
jgi:hypothetical protein